MLAPGLPLSLDPLIAEAKQRMRRRRLVLLAVLAALAVAAALLFALRPSGGVSAARSADGSFGSHRLAQLHVPVSAYELRWRHWIRTYRSRSDELRLPAVIRRALLPRVAASRAEIVRLHVWPETAPPSVELVVATNVSPAAYLQHDLPRLLSAIHGRWRFVEVVDRRGAIIFQNGYRRNAGHFEGMVGVPWPLRACSPVQDWGPTPPPCPVE